MKNIFRHGDKVYCPKFGTGLYTVYTDEYFRTSLTVRTGNGSFLGIDEDGKHNNYDALPSVFHATDENKTLLDKLYGMEFEKPLVPPTSREIIQAMFDRGHKYVPCWVSDLHENPTHENLWTFIREVSEELFTDKNGTEWAFATPFSLETGEEITELTNK